MSLVCWIGFAALIVSVVTCLLEDVTKLIDAAEKLHSTLRKLVRKMQSKLKSR
jgi:predicted ATP-grasp superfamily ATP-dependent carboligase